MRAPSFRKATKGARVSSFYSLPAPALGWNARDSIASMKEAEALIMDNVFPDTTDVMVRKGYFQFATGLSDPIESLIPYNRADGDDQLFCASNGAFYDITSGGAVGAAVQSGLNNSRWQHVNFTNSSGTVYLCCFNGVDAPRYFDGTNWITITGVSTPAITGITTTNIISAAVHKRRMWLVEAGSLKAWYLPVDSVGGAVNAIDLGGIAYKGGFIMAVGTWTIDAGEGMDDYWCAVTSEGQLVVYRGTDPSSSTAWALVGVWDVGQPIGRRCLYKYKSDLLYISLEGVLPLSAAITTGRTDQRVALTDKITQAMSSAAASNKENFGWELVFYPEANMLMLNVPIDEDMNQEQYAMNTVTGAWGGPFSGIEANCWCIFGGEPYFGSDGYVGKFWDSLSDNGANIQFEAQQAYTYLNTRGRLKQVKSVRPYILAGGNFSVVMGVNVDFSQNEITGAISFSAPTYGIWDTALWDVGIWGADLNSYADWQTVNAIGTAVSLRIKGQVKDIEFRYAAADVVYENGGVIA